MIRALIHNVQLQGTVRMVTTFTSTTYPLHFRLALLWLKGIYLILLIRQRNEAQGEVERSLSKIEFWSFQGFRISDGRRIKWLMRSRRNSSEKWLISFKDQGFETRVQNQKERVIPHSMKNKNEYQGLQEGNFQWKTFTNKIKYVLINVLNTSYQGTKGKTQQGAK